MEWVEVTSKSVEEAKEIALDQLGVDESDAEFEVLEEPKAGLFGLLRTQARVRARVVPTTARPKQERRDRKRSSSGGRRDRPASASGPASSATSTGRASAPAGVAPATVGSSAGPGAGGGRSGGGDGSRMGGRPPAGSRAGGGRRNPARDDRTSNSASQEGSGMNEGDPDVDAGELAEEFVEGLLSQFGAKFELERRDIDDDTVEIAVTGEDLGVLIGPRGQTLAAVQELARTVVQRRAPGARTRILVDISGYRMARREALERFTREVAGQVVTSGVARVLDPMSPPDRKVVHDTANTIDGVSTTSEGEEPRRRVVIIPDAMEHDGGS
ncbi:MAG: spoIIIJ-associated protein [Actinomycetota bacterium]|nr:spoIIIJ-associated protein [Actinomycetota bacterium]